MEKIRSIFAVVDKEGGTRRWKDIIFLPILPIGAIVLGKGESGEFVRLHTGLFRVDSVFVNFNVPKEGDLEVTYSMFLKEDNVVEEEGVEYINSNWT